MIRFILAALAIATLPAVAEEASWVGDARKVASAMPPKLLGVLTEEIQKGGPESAVAVCRDKAPQMAKAASEQSGWAIRRVSLRNRNPKAVPDAWERTVLEEFDRRAAAGEAAPTLEKSEVVADGDNKVQRYMKALPTQEVCLSCHGAADNLSTAVSEQLRKLYPDDKAVGYKPGEIRGAITLKRAAQ
jgi:hypothetical protein